MKNLWVLVIFIIALGILLIALPFVYISKIISEPYQIQKSTILVNQSFMVQSSTVVIRTIYLNAGDLLNIQVEVERVGAFGINFSLNDGATTYLYYPQLTSLNENWTAPIDSSYNFIFDNKFGYSKDVTFKVTKYWTETAYRDVMHHNQLLPFESAYLGASFILIGILLIICVARRRS